MRQPLAASILVAAVAVAQPPKGVPPAAKPGTITLNRPIENFPLRDVLQYLAETHKVRFSVASKGVPKGEKPFEDRTVKLAKLNAVPLAFVVEVVAQQAGATSRKAGDQFVIEAGKPKDLTTLLSKPSPKALAKVAEPAKIDKDIQNIPLREMLDFLGEKYDVSIFVDDAGFRRIKKDRDVLTEAVDVRAQETALEKLLSETIAKLGGKVVVREELIAIVPEIKPAK